MIKKILPIALGAPLLIAIVAVVAGIVKFNVLGDDLYVSATSDNIVGRWYEGPVRDFDRASSQGFELLPDGTAKPIGATTPAYTSWELSQGELALKIADADDQKSAETVEVYEVELKLDLDEMTLVSPGGDFRRYFKAPDDEPGPS